MFRITSTCKTRLSPQVYRGGKLTEVALLNGESTETDKMTDQLGNLKRLGLIRVAAIQKVDASAVTTTSAAVTGKTPRSGKNQK